MTTSKPSIMQVLPTLRVGGVERGAIDIAIAAKKAGYNSIVVSSGGDLVRHLESAGVTHVKLPVHSKNPLRIYTNIQALTSLIRLYDINIVHARSRAPAWSAYYAAKRVGVHFLTTFHGTYDSSTSLKRKYNQVMVRGEKVIAISDFISSHVQEIYGVDSKRIVTVPRGVDFDKFSRQNVTQPRLMQLLQQWQFPAELPLILTPARLTRWKGQDVLLKALAKLPHRNFYCILLGDDGGKPWYVRELHDLVTSLDLIGHVKIVRHTFDMPAAYMLSSLVVVASQRPEAFGRVAVEAQAMEVPVVATNHGGAKETIQHGKTGFLAAPGDVDSLSEAIGKALELTEKEKEKMVNAAQAYVRKNYSLEQMAEKTLTVYKQLAAGK